MNNKYAFLFLTYNDLNQPLIWDQFFKKGANIYIHPKYKNRLKSKYKKYVIGDHISTTWGDISIVEATLLLLKEAYKNKHNEYFTLCSNSCVPLYSFNKYIQYINSFKNKLSFFNFKEEIISNEINIISKTSQFWILNREDVEVILKNSNKYLKIFKNKAFIKKYITGKSAPDELYFLTLLKNEIKDYKYNNILSTYTKWFYNYVRAKHPLTYLNFTQEDMKEFKKEHSFFVRKIGESFHLNIKLNKPDLFLIIYIGEYTSSELIHKITKLINLQSVYLSVYLMIITYGEYEIPKSLLSKCYYTWNISGSIEELYKYLIKYQATFFCKRFGKGVTYLLGDERSDYQFIDDIIKYKDIKLDELAGEKDKFYFIS